MHRIAGCLAVAFVLAAPVPARAAPDAIPEARQVVVRGQKQLDAALYAAFGGGTDVGVGTAAIVVDVTPHVRAAETQLRDALTALATRTDLPDRWQITRLGQPFSKSRVANGPAALGAMLPALLQENTDVSSTIIALRRSIKSLKVRDGTVIYLADWRFEDEHDVEGLIKLLATKRLRFGVVGSEAAFGRGWNDGVLDIRDQMENGQLVVKSGAERKDYDETIGRKPFGPFEKKAPWHGGDSAYPHLPYRFSEDLWVTEFSPSDLRSSQASKDGKGGKGGLDGFPDLEDLLERRGRSPEVFASSGGRRFALPSAFGSHGLMRTVAKRGGRYVLWSWNPEHRVSLKYDFARCDMFGPDLRSRAQIRSNVPHQPAAIAMLRAWDAIGSKFNALAAHTAPLDRSGSGPRSIDLLERSARSLPLMWPRKELHRDFLKKVGHWRDAAQSGIDTLTRGLERAAKKDGSGRRYRADAELMRHILVVLHFELSEAHTAASAVPDDAWDSESTHPGLRSVTWIERGDDPDAIRKTDVVPHDPKLGVQLEEARREHLRRFGGTPFGAQVAANTVDTWRLEAFPKMESSPGKPRLPGRTPSESSGTPKPTPKTPGGPSGGSGGTTGR